MKEYRIAVIPGDGLGKEVIPEGCRILDRISATTADGKVLTPDLGSHATTHEIGQEISRKIQEYTC